MDLPMKLQAKPPEWDKLWECRQVILAMVVANPQITIRDIIEQTLYNRTTIAMALEDLFKSGLLALKKPINPTPDGTVTDDDIYGG